MSIPLQSARVYSDLQGLSELRHSADSNSAENLRFVAQQFEALFMQMMLKSAHGIGEDEQGLFEGEQTEFYQDWYDKQLAIHLSSGRGIGIADILVEQLKQQQLLSQDSSVGSHDKKDPAQGFVLPEVSIRPPVNFQSPESMRLDKLPEPTLGSAESFVKHLLPYAKLAGKELGVDPEVLLAQAALETGWGKYINKSAKGESSHNLFNIKSDHRWQGPSINVATLEYENGMPRKENAQFRAYDSYRASFEDYVNFLQSGSRYQDALAVAGDKQAYTQELARAGYATDPDYSSKIMNIVDGDPLKMALQSVKL